MEIKNAFPLQAIETKFLGPTNTKGARVKATAQCGSKTIPWDHSKNPEDNHKAAAEALIKAWDWDGVWYIGGSPKGHGCVFVRVNDINKD